MQIYFSNIEVYAVIHLKNLIYFLSKFYNYLQISCILQKTIIHYTFDNYKHSFLLTYQKKCSKFSIKLDKKAFKHENVFVTLTLYSY